MLWRLPRRTEKGADTIDLEGNRSTSTRKRDRSEDRDSITPKSRLELGRESPHPLLEVIDNLETGKEVPGPTSLE
ncbi:hypothetical protein NDU88_006765 [Pleurodeles waltl]|uniref:Uncharacterized protein n=1 Tax=Pleurodeles waltl TaxID=8319 RepID=A0AAV7NSV2_PLEWA|nr:hypothetical protein NDU88_006765 [Pleurodeles waltl]